MNTVECVIAGHEKASHFSGLKQLFHGVCWSLLYINLAMSTLSSQWVIVKLRTWDKEKNRRNIAAVMVFSIFIFVGGITINIYALAKVKQHCYVSVFFGSMWFVLLRRAIWCTYIYRKCKNVAIIECLKSFERNLTKGHGGKTSKNFFSVFLLYPAIFMACHHLL